MATDEALALLRSIDGTLKQLLAQQQKAIPKEVATDRDLDGKYGDPVLKFMPRDWMGESYKDRHFSECPAGLLDMVAETFDYFAGQAEAKNELYNGKPVAPYKRMDAARARGWAVRVRSGRVPPRQANGNGHDDWTHPEPAPRTSEPQATDGFDDIPF